MSEPTEHNELAAFQDALARLAPTADGINIARLLFEAGQLSAPRRSWAWPCAAAASLMLAAALGAVLVLRPTPQPVERIVTVYVQPPDQPAPQLEPALPSTDEAPSSPLRPITDENDDLQLRREVLANGLDALPPPPLWPAPMPADDAGTLLDLPRDSRDPWLMRLNRSLQPGGPP